VCVCFRVCVCAYVCVSSVCVFPDAPAPIPINFPILER